jgi:hypothetical protein
VLPVTFFAAERIMGGPKLPWRNVRFTPNSGHPDLHNPEIPPEALIHVIACPGPLSGSIGSHQDRVDHAMNAGTLALGLVRLWPLHGNLGANAHAASIKDSAAARAMMGCMLKLS